MATNLITPIKEYQYSSGQSRMVVPTNVGYQVAAPVARNDAANGILIAPDGLYMPLLISEYNTSFELSGSMGQSQMTRTFFPRNFVQPQFALIGQSPNQHEYNRLGEFIHYAQRLCIRQNDVLQLETYSGGTDIKTKKIKGLNRGFIARGYIQNTQRGGAFSAFAPQWQFSFIIAWMSRGLYSEQPATIRKLKSWTELVTPHTESFVVNPDSPPSDQPINPFSPNAPHPLP